MNKMIIAMLSVTIALAACKKDDDGDLIPPPSTTTGLFINEVYSSNPDWIELYNSTDSEINLSGFILQDDKGAAEEYKIPAGTKIAAKSFLVIDTFTFGLSSSQGDIVKLLDTKSTLIDEITLPIMKSEESYARITDGATNWQKSSTPTKGKSNNGATEAIKLFINEVQTAPDGDDVDFIEIYNDETTEVNIGGFILQDDKGAPEQFIIPQGTKIAAKGLIVFSQVSPNAGVGFSFGLSSKGDNVILLNNKGAVIDQINTPDFGNSKGQSYARISNGGSQWQILDTPTKGTDNPAEALVSYIGKIVINEVYTFSNQSSADDLDWIELYNTTDAEIAIGGMLLWESGGRGEAWTIPADKKIAAKSHLLIECDKYALLDDPINHPSWGLSKGPDEYIVLANADFTKIDSISCPSLNRNESYGRKTDGAAEWQIFAQYTKGSANTGDARTEHINTMGVYINEVYHDNSSKTGIENAGWDPEVDFIELYNSTNSQVDISDWEIYDDTDDDSKKYVVPAGTVIPAKGYLVYDVFKTNPNGPQFGLGVGGDWVYIYKPGKSELVDVMEIPGFSKESGLRDKGYTFGRLTDGSTNLTIFKEASKGASNNGKEVISQE